MVKSTGFCNELVFGFKISKSAANLDVFFYSLNIYT